MNCNEQFALRCAIYAQISASAILERFLVSRQYVSVLRKQMPSISDTSPERLCQSLFKEQSVIFADDRFFEKMILSLTLDGTSSIEGIQRVLENVFGHPVSIGKISNILNHVAEKAAGFNQSIDLSSIRVGGQMMRSFRMDPPS